MFSFQFFNNALSVGARNAARYRNVGNDFDQRCTFCVKGGMRQPARDTFRHLFLDCPVMVNTVNIIFQLYFGKNFTPRTQEGRLLKTTGLVTGTPPAVI